MSCIHHDTKDPGSELPSRVIAMDVLPRREKAILCGVISVFGVVEDGSRHPPRRRAVSADQLTKRLTVAPLGRNRQVGVGYLRTTQRGTPMLNSVPWGAGRLDSGSLRRRAGLE